MKIGIVKGVKGLKGELRVHLLSGEAPWKNKVKKLMVGVSETSLLERDIQRISIDSQGLLLKLVGIDSREEAEALKKFEVFIEEKFFETAKGESIYLREILGFEVYDKDVLVGKVASFSTNGAQDLLVVRSHDKDCLIPFVKSFILRIDSPARRIFMDLPGGLLTLDENKKS